MTQLIVPPDGSTAPTAAYQGAHSILVMVIGKPGRGKSTSIRTLPPDRTHIINVMGKELPFAGGRQFVEGKNMTTLVEGAHIREKLKSLSLSGSCDFLVIDDLHYVMASEFMSKVMVKGYEKFSIMARNIWDILVQANRLRPWL